MRAGARPFDRIGARALLIAACVGSSAATAQPVVDAVVSDAQLIVNKGCTILKVNFNSRIQYVSHFPLDRGTELRISINLLDKEPMIDLRQLRLRREAVTVPNGKVAGIKAIVLDLDQASGPVLRIQFDNPVAYKVAERSDNQSVNVAVSGKNPSAACSPDLPAAAGGAGPARRSQEAPGLGGGVSARPKGRVAGKLSEEDAKIVAASMDEARDAMRKNNYGGAIELFTKVLKYPESKDSAEAQELLGLARQKADQLAGARAEYEDYLRRYPSGEGSDRVRQRLDGILTAAGGPSEKLRLTSEQAIEAEKKLKPERTSETSWTISGSASEFYIRDDSNTTVHDPTVAPNPNEDPDAHRVHQDTVLTNLDLRGTLTGERVNSQFRFSGSEEHQFNSGGPDRVGVAALSWESKLRELDLMARVGRQSRATGGVVGRFDGGLMSWQANPTVRINVVAGSPDYSRFDAPFKDEKYFYGTSVDLGRIIGRIDTSVFVLEQRDRSVIDRRSVGTELRYFDSNKNALATIDYDIYFMQLNAAILSGSWTLQDKSILSGAFDYRKTPYLSSWTALQGQPFVTLYDMLRVYSQSEVRQFAIDRTPSYGSAMIAYSRPLNDKLQVSVDVTATDASGTATSGGVDGTTPTGVEYYYSAQLIGSGIFTAGDMYVSALRYASLTNADQTSSKMYVLDFNSMYPLGKQWRISPRLRLGDRTNPTEYTVLPSVLADYNWSKDLSLELEVGTKRMWSSQAGIKTTATDLFVTAGVRYDFGTEGNNAFAADGLNSRDLAGRSKCPLPQPVCPLSVRD